MGKRWDGAKRGAILEVLALVGFLAILSGIGGYDVRAAFIFGGAMLSGASIWGLSR